MSEEPTGYRFPFGRPVCRRPPSATSQRDVFVLGAYPSAFHVQWIPPPSLSPVRAIAVDNEPEPFWNGNGGEKTFEAWKKTVGWKEEWGTVSVARDLNGSSGRWLDDNLFGRVVAGQSITRATSWITDCLDTYRASTALAGRVKDTYGEFPEQIRLPAVKLPRHPSESEIVEEACRCHRERLLAELRTAHPRLVITLGNAALRVIRTVLCAENLPQKLDFDPKRYGARHECSFDGWSVEVLPLAHPAAPKPYQEAHASWLASFAPKR